MHPSKFFNPAVKSLTIKHDCASYKTSIHMQSTLKTFVKGARAIIHLLWPASSQPVVLV